MLLMRPSSLHKRNKLVFRPRHQQNIAPARGQIARKDFADPARCAGDESGVHLSAQLERVQFNDVWHCQ